VPVAVDTLAAMAVERAVAQLPHKQRTVLRWAYVWPALHVNAEARELGCSGDGLVALLAFLSYIVWFPPKKTAIDYDRDAITLCWQEYKRKSLDPNTKRLIAKLCEDRESPFLKTYNAKP